MVTSRRKYLGVRTTLNGLFTADVSHKKFLGLFRTEEQAARAYDEAKLEAFGPLNAGELNFDYPEVSKARRILQQTLGEKRLTRRQAKALERQQKQAKARDAATDQQKQHSSCSDDEDSSSDSGPIKPWCKRSPYSSHGDNLQNLPSRTSFREFNAQLAKEKTEEIIRELQGGCNSSLGEQPLESAQPVVVYLVGGKTHKTEFNAEEDMRTILRELPGFNFKRRT